MVKEKQKKMFSQVEGFWSLAIVAYIAFVCVVSALRTQVILRHWTWMSSRSLKYSTWCWCFVTTFTCHQTDHSLNKEVSAIPVLIAISPDPHPSQTGRFTLGWLYPLLHSLAKVECFILVSRLNDNRWFSRCQMHKSCLEIGTNLIQNVFCSVLLQMDNATAETVRW